MHPSTLALPAPAASRLWRLALAAMLALLASALLASSALAAPCEDCTWDSDGGATAGSSLTYAYKLYESAGHLNTNKFVNAGQRVEIKADPQRQIWAGVWLSGNNGPAGWASLGNSQTPMPSARAFSLLARVGSEFYPVGNGTTFTAQASGCVELWINDDVIGNGNGYFGIFSVKVL